jgi:hypothetical protein
MQLIYTDDTSTTIKVILAEGETLGHLVGPIAAAFVPVDPANVDYAAILEQELPIDPYVAPQER